VLGDLKTIYYNVQILIEFIRIEEENSSVWISIGKARKKDDREKENWCFSIDH